VNMSRIDNATLILNVTTGAAAAKLRVYGFGVNVLRILNGMGGLNIAGLKNTLACQIEIRQAKIELVVSNKWNIIFICGY
jgi:hypothetical protein